MNTKNHSSAYPEKPMLEYQNLVINHFEEFMLMLKSFSFLFMFVVFLFLSTTSNLAAKDYSLLSPNKKIQLRVQINKIITYAVRYDQNELITYSPISMTVNDGKILGQNPRVKNVQKRTVNKILTPVVKVKSKSISDHYNEMTIHFKDRFALIFRAYDDGIAYRFMTKFKNNIKVKTEEVSFNFAEDFLLYFPEEESFFSHSERLYFRIPISQVTHEKMCSLPALVDLNSGKKLAITEADLKNYPGMYLTGLENAPTSLRGKFPYYPLEVEQKNDRNVPVTKRADYLATTQGSRSFPWRVLILAENDKDLLVNQMVYKLALPLQLKDTSWIKPGKVAWDWWNWNNIYGVDFRAGVNTETYKYYINFASKYGIEYIILDEGWYKLGDLFAVVPGINIEEIVEYGNKKNVGIILWVIWKTLDDQLTEALDQFQKWGIKGIKVDFMQRDDQWMVNYYERIAGEAAKRKLLVDFHGSYKPAGLRRAYPNVLTREGVKGLENYKWSDQPSLDHNLTLPFIRMLAGPMDYTPGAMINATAKQFKPVHSRPMSPGTRCHQLAMYVVFESPLQMLADSPSNYLREPECMDFLSRVPTTWDETRVIDAKVSEYVLIARQNRDEWYIGALTNWTPRDFTVDLSFLGQGKYTTEIYQDGINADRAAIDYKKVVRIVETKDQLSIHLAPGGGWVGRLYQ